MSLKKTLLAATLAFGLAVLPAAAQTLRVGFAAQDVGRLDPHFAVSTTDRVPVGWMFNGLVRFKPGSASPADLEPDLAESWEHSADGKTWTFKLRRGVQFHGNYGEMTAEDVVFSLQKAADPKRSAFSADFRAIESVSAVDPYTVRIVLKENVPSLLGLVTNYSGGYIVSKKAVEERGDGFARAPIGTGPFALDKVTPNQSAEFVAHAAYFRGKPQLTGVSYRFIPSDASRDLAYQNGELDVNYGKEEQRWVDRTRALPHTIVDIFEPAEMAFMSLNTTAAPFNDIRVRQAMAYAINRPEIIRWRGAAITREARSVVPGGYLGFSDAAPFPALDIAKAKSLLAEAGYPNGLTIKVIHTQLPEMLAAMQVVQAQLKRAGITLDLQVVEHATFHTQIRQDLSPLVYYSAARFPIADIFLTQFFHGRSIVRTPTAVTNFSHCSMADAEIDAARVSTDPAEQARLWAAAQKKLAEAVCAVPLFEALKVFARRDNVDYGYELKGSMSLGPVLTEASRIK
jgi:peptide/nickel transport system substrate-binding protein